MQVLHGVDTIGRTSIMQVLYGVDTIGRTTIMQVLHGVDTIGRTSVGHRVNFSSNFGHYRKYISN